MSTSSEAQGNRKLRFKLRHLLILTSLTAVFAWWTTIAGIENAIIRVEGYKAFPDQAMDNEPYEATVRVRVVSPKYSIETAKFIVIRAFIEPIEGFDDPSNFVGRQFEFQYQKHSAFGRQSESLATAAFKQIYSGRFQVYKETTHFLSIDST